MLKYKYILLILVFCNAHSSSSQTQRQSYIVHDFARKFTVYYNDFITKSATLMEFDKMDEANTLSELGNIANRYSMRFEHIYDLITINNLTNEKAVTDFVKGRMNDMKAESIKKLHEAMLKYIDSVIENMRAEALKEKIKQFKIDLIAGEAIVESL